MITRTNQNSGRWLQRLRGKQSGLVRSGDLLDPASFDLAMEKERCRSERRDLTFCVITFDLLWVPQDDTASIISQLARQFRQRIRIVDEIGVWRDDLAVLLPETIPSEAAVVANELVEIATRQKLRVSTEIHVWPEIDFDNRPSNESGNSGVLDLRVGDHVTRGGSSRNGSDEEPGAAGEVLFSRSSDRQPTPGEPRSFRIHKLNTSIDTPWWKRSMDIVGATSGLLLLSPLFAVSALLVKLDSKGPVIFRQWREGKDGQLFQIYKFRTMRSGADQEQAGFRDVNEQDGPAFKLKNDPRVTAVGRYLRKTCIDELPQLLNVLKGEMSIVGPRPLPVDESLNCSAWHRRRLDVLPGMTCTWQVTGGRDVSFDDWMRMDLDYIRRQGPTMDVGLIFKTAIVTLLHRGSV